MATKTRDRRSALARRRRRPASPRQVAANQDERRTGRARRQASASGGREETQTRPLRRVIRRSERYPDGKCHVCGLPQMRGKALCEKHERLWRQGQIRLSRAGAARQVEKGNAEVTLFIYGKPQEVERPKRGRRPRKEAK